MEKKEKCYIGYLLGMFKGRRNNISGFKKFHGEEIILENESI